jgi:hypothetical protein
MKITCFRRFLPRRRRRGLHSLIAHFGLAPKRLYESAFPFGFVLDVVGSRDNFDPFIFKHLENDIL